MDKEKIFSDTVFWFAALLISLTIIFLFDLQWNFSSPEWFVFTNTDLYVIGGFVGSVIGFFLIKSRVGKGKGLEKNK